MARPDIDVTIKNIKGSYQPLNIFKYLVEDGIRKRLPKGVADLFYREIINNIDTNRFNFELSKRWIDYKRRIGADTKPFVMFGYYKDAIQVVTSEGHITVGFKKLAMHPRAKISIGDLAVKLEYGDLSKNIPARPLWRQTAGSFKQERKSALEKVVKEAILHK